MVEAIGGTIQARQQVSWHTFCLGLILQMSVTSAGTADISKGNKHRSGVSKIRPKGQVWSVVYICTA